MRVLIIEDEPKAARRIGKLLRELRENIIILASLESIEDSLIWLSENDVSEVDLALVDIELADGNSFEIFEHVNVDFPIVFTTAYNEYVMEAFRVNTVDYLLKPIKQEELARALDKHERIYRQNAFEGQGLTRLLKDMDSHQYQRRFITRVGRKTKIIPAGEVAYFFSEDKISFVMHLDGRRYPLDLTLAEIETRVDPNLYFRANRQYIVRIDSIALIHTLSKSRLKLELKPKPSGNVIVSSEKSASFKKWIES